VHAFEITSEVGADGRHVLRHHVLVSFRVGGIDQLQLEGFNDQNAIMGLDIVDSRHRQLEGLRYEVRFDASFGMSASFLCRDVAVERVRPWDGESEKSAG
jgi:hypothetical protein